jgi:hypothetical protein
MKEKTIINVLIILVFGFSNSIMAQLTTFKVAHFQGYFSIEETSLIEATDLLLTLSNCGCYSMEVYGDKILLGTERYQDFFANQEQMNKKYQKKVNGYGCYDSSVSYEIVGEHPEKVLFYFYRTTISGPIPTGNFALTDGIYTLLIYNNEQFETSMTIAIKDNTITKI